MMDHLRKFDLLGVAGLRPKKNLPDPKYASFNRRMFAATIDSFIAMITIGPLLDWLVPIRTIDMFEMQQKLQSDINEGDATRYFMQTLAESGILTNFAAQMGALALLSAFCWRFWGATPGKMLLRLKVVDAKTDGPVSDVQIAWRIFGYSLSLVPPFIGFFWIGFDRRRQGWHDKLADTTVIIVRKKTIPGSEAAAPSGSPEP